MDILVIILIEEEVDMLLMVEEEQEQSVSREEEERISETLLLKDMMESNSMVGSHSMLRTKIPMVLMDSMEKERLL